MHCYNFFIISIQVSPAMINAVFIYLLLSKKLSFIIGKDNGLMHK